MTIFFFECSCWGNTSAFAKCVTSPASKSIANAIKKEVNTKTGGKKRICYTKKGKFTSVTLQALNT